MNEQQFELELEKFRTEREKMAIQREQWQKDFDLKYQHWFFQKGIWILSLVVTIAVIITKWLLS